MEALVRLAEASAEKRHLVRKLGPKEEKSKATASS
jgi:hypothetical protein